MSAHRMTFDHDLKIQRAWKHLEDLNAAEAAWLNGDHHSIRQERDPKTGDVRVFGTVSEQPSADPFSLLIGDFLHNVRSALDLLAYALASAHTKPFPQNIAESSEFPIFGDENKRGQPGFGPDLFRDNGRSKIAGWNPGAQTIVEGLQPYQRGNAYRDDPLWHLHELDRVNKHRLLHAVVAGFEGTAWDLTKSLNVKGIGPGTIKSLGSTLETDTPIAVIPHVSPVDPDLEMHVDIQPALAIAFSKGTPCVQDEPVLQTFNDLYLYVVADIINPLRPFL